jgi:hypothetical protein
MILAIIPFKEGELKGNNDTYHAKMVELVKRLTIATEQGMLEWETGGDKSPNVFSTDVDGSTIRMKFEEAFGEILVQVSDSAGNSLVSIDSTRIHEKAERLLFRQLLEVVQVKEEGLDKFLDSLLAKLPESR